MAGATIDLACSGYLSITSPSGNTVGLSLARQAVVVISLMDLALPAAPHPKYSALSQRTAVKLKS